MNSSTSNARTKYPDAIGWACFIALCLITGSTFLGMRVAVADGAFPPWTMAASRFTVAGGVMLVALRLAGQSCWPGWRQFVPVATAGVLLCGGGTGLASLASRSVGSGLVAIFFALGPIYTAVIEAVITGRRPSVLGVVGMFLGALGVAALFLPSGTAIPSDSGVVAALILGPMCYAAGAVVVKRYVHTDIFVAIGYQMIAGAVPLWAAAWITSEPIPAPTSAGWVAWVYLTGVSSLAGFGVYMVALKRLPTPVFMSHSWVIPVVAMVLGWAVLGEALEMHVYLSGGLIIAGLVALVTAPSRMTVRPSVEFPPTTVPKATTERLGTQFLSAIRKALASPNC